MSKIMFKSVCLLAFLLLLNSACRVNGECTEDGLDCILDEHCCTGYCDWSLSYYPFSGGCGPRPPGPIPPKPCIKFGSGHTCVYNVTCCEGYCERRYTTEGFCVIGAPPGFGVPPSEPPAPIAVDVAPISAPPATEIVPISAPIATPDTPADTPLPTDLAPILSPGGVIIPPYDVPIAPTKAPSKKDGHKHKPVAPTRAPSKKDKPKHKPVAPTRAPSKKNTPKHKPVAPTPAPSKKNERKIKPKKKGKTGSLTCTKAHAPAPAY